MRGRGKSRYADLTGACIRKQFPLTLNEPPQWHVRTAQSAQLSLLKAPLLPKDSL